MESDKMPDSRPIIIKKSQLKKDILYVLEELSVIDNCYVISDIKRTTSNDLLVLAVYSLNMDGYQDLKLIHSLIDMLKVIADKNNFTIDHALADAHIFFHFCS